MFTGIDVLVIVLITIFFTAIVTSVFFACVIANSVEKDKEEAYRQGIEEGKRCR